MAAFAALCSASFLLRPSPFPAGVPLRSIANQTIYIGGEYPSSVTLPTLSLGA